METGKCRDRGTPVIDWVTICYLGGSIWGCVLADNVSYYNHEVVGGLGGFGILVGWVIEMVHGFIRLAFYRSRPTDSIADAKTDLKNPDAPPGCRSEPYGKR